MSILEYMLANQKQKEDLREGYVDVLKNSNTADFIKAFPEVFKHSNTYKLGAGIGNLAKDAASGVSNFVSDITFNPLPYGEYARSAYDGMQNLYGNTLDRGLDNVIDYFSPNPITSGGPLSRGSRYMNDLTFVPGSDMNRMTNSYYNAEMSRLMDENPYYTNGIFTGIKKVPLEPIQPNYVQPNYEANLPGTMMFQDNPIPKSSDDRVYYQETDTGPEYQMQGPLSDKSIDQIVSEYNEEQKRLGRNYNRAGDRIRGDR